MLQQPQGESPFMPHGMCYLWEPDLLWLHVISDIATGVAYWAIPPTLLLLVVRARREVPEGAGYESKRLPHEWMFLMFGLFIIACGTTHLFAAWNVWNADYWLSGGAKAVTAAVSVATAVALPPLVPRALKLVHNARESEVRRVRLEAANRELETLNERLREMDEQKTRFFANVSHELRTPLTLIRGPVERQLAETDDPELRDDMQLVMSNARLLERRVRDLLDLSSQDGGEGTARYSPADMSALVVDARRRFADVAARREIDLEVRAPDAFQMETDPDKAERIIDNLVSNAFKFTPDGGSVRLTLEPHAAGSGDRSRHAPGDDHGEEHGEEHAQEVDEVVLRVSDSGPGIPPEQRGKVFDRFHQVGGSAASGRGGSGLGLAIVRDFVHLLGGTVEVDADPEIGGARFTVRLPTRAAGRSAAGRGVPQPVGERGHDEPSAPAEPGAGAAPGSAAASSLPAEERSEADGPEGGPNETAQPRVLVVEDVAEMRELLRRALGDHHEIRLADGGEEALEILDGWAPDLVVTDLMMPDMDGETLVGRIREGPHSELPVLVLSARADDEMRVRLLRGGADDYVTKPFAAEELRARVRNLVSMKRVRELLRSELASATGDVQSLVQELSRRHRELEAALKEVRRARDEAETASRAKSEFLAVMSHELRTPLNAIIGYAELVEAGVAGEVSGEQKQHLGRIRTGARHLLAVIEDILAFSRDESTPRPLDPEAIDLTELIEEVVDGQVPAAHAKGLELETYAEEGTDLRTDRERLRRVLTNLVSNAVKFTDEGRVRVSARNEDDQVALEVMDTGVGIDASDREQIFEPFWQVDQSSTRTAGGTGLGLSIVQRLVEQLGGTLELESAPGEGSTFTVRLPKEPATKDSTTEGQRKDT